tara:strand:+ start:2001 stop:2231 length:231 start_codon:yes stop_codon:yes gene_type:complete
MVLDEKRPTNHGYTFEVNKYTSDHTDTIYFEVRIQKGQEQMEFSIDSFPLVDLEKVLEVVDNLTKACISAIEGKYD